MIKKLVARSRFTRWNRAFSVLLVVALLAPLMVMAPASEAAPRAQPVLLAMAAERPDETVGVIVQKLGNGTNVEDLVARLSGVVTKDLHIINAIAAQLPAKAVPELAKAAGVRWVSFDAPVRETGNGPQRFYLHADPSPPEADTASQPLLPLSGVVPQAETLYNYDQDRDASPGLTILPGGTNAQGGPYFDDPQKYQRWRLNEPLNKDIRIAGKVKLPLWSAVKNFRTGARGVVNLYVYDSDGATSTLIGSGIWDEINWQIGTPDFVQKTITIQNVDYLLPAGHYLEIVLTVGEESEDAMWIAYDTVSYSSSLEIPRGDWSSVFLEAIGAEALWAEGLEGAGVAVAIVDSGITQATGGGGKNDSDFLTEGKGKQPSRVLDSVMFNSFTQDEKDRYGHGTHVAGTIGGNGKMSKGEFKGVAPKVNFINVKVSDDRGAGMESDVVDGLQWVLDNKDVYNIRVVNISLNSSSAQSYHTSPLDAAVEILWFNGIVVVVSAGNNGTGEDSGILYPPANDPFVITVGAIDDRQTQVMDDDELVSFSAYGTTENGFAKPDVVAPGVNIIAVLAQNNAELIKGHPDHRVEKEYFRMSGTSMSSAVTSGAVALLLQDEPGLNPDQVKYRLMATARPFDGPEPGSTGAGYLDIHAAVHGTTMESANTGIMPHQLLAKMALMAYWASGNGGDDIDWGSVNWDSVNWDSVNWDSVNWDSVNWDSVNWDSVNWDSVNWDSVNWDSVNWDSVNWDSVNWDSVNWDSVNWDSVNWDSVNWSSVNWD